MAPRNLMLSIALGAFTTLTHPFTFIARAVKAAAGALGRSVRSNVKESEWTEELLRRLEWRRFEELCAAYFDAARIDRSGMLVHCLPWDAYRVGVKPVRELRGAMTTRELGKGLLMTSGKFTKEARDFAAKEHIRLIDGPELLGGIAALAPETSQALLQLATQGDYSTPTCPACNVKMTQRKSTSAGRAFWGCRNYPRCKETVAGAP